MLDWLARNKDTGEAPFRVGTDIYVVLPTVSPDYVEIRSPTGLVRRLTRYVSVAEPFDDPESFRKATIKLFGLSDIPDPPPPPRKKMTAAKEDDDADRS